MVIAHSLEWTCASPLWGPAVTADRTAMRRPTILAFDNDAFIDELTATLAKDPVEVGKKIAVYETFREDTPKPPALPRLKLYQPAHGRHYLVAANLVCQIPGIPDRVVDKAKDESVSFVLRRIDDKQNELAWVITRPGLTPEGEWRAVPQPRAVVPGEQLYPMFGLPYGDKGKRRKLNIGLVPVGMREQFEAAEIAAAPPDVPEVGDPRFAVVEARVVDALDRLKQPVDPSNEELEVQATSFMLLDLAEWLQREAASFWTALQSGVRPSNAGGALFDALQGLVDTNASGTWGAAMKAVLAERDILLGDATGTPTSTRNGRRAQLDAATLRARLDAFVKELPAIVKPTVPPPKKGEEPVDATGLLYIIRTVYQRPRCGALHKDVVSDPSTDFILAPFYDFDAPVRPVRIALPIDTSIAGLRKFKKNVSFVLSKSLRKQLSRTTEKALDGKFGSGKSFELGEICSFSIPVITICALIVLMVFIQLLNIVFWWVPFLKFCIPIPQPKKP